MVRGGADAYSGDNAVPIKSYDGKTIYLFQVDAANTTTTPTFNFDGKGAKTAKGPYWVAISGPGSLRKVPIGFFQTGVTYQMISVDVSGTIFMVVLNDPYTAPVYHMKKTILSADIKLLNTTPYEIIGAPGAGMYIDVVSAHMNVVLDTAAYVCGANGIYLRNTSSSALFSLTQAAVQAAATELWKMNANAAAVKVTQNEPLQLYAPDSDPTTGAGDWVIDIVFRISTLLG